MNRTLKLLVVTFVSIMMLMTVFGCGAPAAKKTASEKVTKSILKPKKKKSKKREPTTQPSSRYGHNQYLQGDAALKQIQKVDSCREVAQRNQCSGSAKPHYEAAVSNTGQLLDCAVRCVTKSGAIRRTF